MEPELRQILKGCKTRAEADRIVAAYMREAKGRENLNDKILLGRKRKETGAKKPVRKIPEPSKPPPPKIVEKPKPPEPPKPPPRAPSPIESESSESEEDRKRTPSPPPKKPEPSRKVSSKPRQPEKSVQEKPKQLSVAELDRENTPPEKLATAKSKVVEQKTPAKKGLFDYYSKGAASKQSLEKSKPSLQYVQKEPKPPPTPITPPPKAKRKKKKPKKKVSGFADFSSSESESETPRNNPKKPSAKKPPVSSSSSDSSSSDENHDIPNSTKAQPTPKPSLTKPIKAVRNNIPSDSDESSEEDKKKVVKQVAVSDSDSDEEPAKVATKKVVQTKSDTDDSDSDVTVDTSAGNKSKETSKTEKVVVSPKVAEVSEVVVAKAATTSDVVTSNESRKEKAVHWDSEVTSPKPTARKPKRDKKGKKKKKLAIVKEEEEEETVEVVKEAPVIVKEEIVAVETKPATPNSPIHSRPTSAKSDASSQVEHVRDDPALTGPLFPSTLSLQSRHSQQLAQAELLPSAVEEKDELQEQLNAMDSPAEETKPAPVIADPIEKKTNASDRRPREPGKTPERDLSPYQVLPDIPSTTKKTEWPSISKLQGKGKQKTEDSLIIYAKPHKKGGKKREKKDFTPYLDALDQACDSSLQYIVAKTGAKLGVDQHASVVRARVALMMNEKKTAKLDQKILGRLQNENGAYKKRIDKFLSKP